MRKSIASLLVGAALTVGVVGSTATTVSADAGNVSVTNSCSTPQANQIYSGNSIYVVVRNPPYRFHWQITASNGAVYASGYFYYYNQSCYIYTNNQRYSAYSTGYHGYNLGLGTFTMRVDDSWLTGRNIGSNSFRVL